MSDAVPMLNDVNKIPTSHAVFTVESNLNAAINAKTAVYFWDNGAFINGTPVTGDMIIMTDSITAVSSGSAVFNLTSDHTATGTALCSSILVNSCVANFVDSAGLYAQGAPTIAGSKKTATIPVTKRTDNSLVILTSITVIGSATQSAAPNATTVKFFGIGVAA